MEAIGVPPPISTTGPSAGSFAQRHGVLLVEKVMTMGRGDGGQLGLGGDIVERKKPSPVGGVFG